MSRPAPRWRRFAALVGFAGMLPGASANASSVVPDSTPVPRAASRAPEVRGGVGDAGVAAAPFAPVVPQAQIDLALSRTRNATFVRGQNELFTVSITNIGALTTTGILTNTFNLPTGLTYVSATGAGWTCAPAGAAVTCTSPGPLAQNQSTSIALVVAVALNAPSSVIIRSRVNTPGEPANKLTNNFVEDATPISNGAPDLAIVKSAAATPFVVGQNATYSLTITNVGQFATSGTTSITDVLPAGLTYVSATGAGWSCGVAAATVSCTTSAVFAPGATSAVTLTVAVGAAARPSVSNTATVSTPGDPNPSNDTSTITVPVIALDLAIAKRHTGNFTVGQNGLYTLTVTNVSAVTTTGAIQVVDNIPAGLGFVSASGTGWTCAAAGAVVTCNNAGPLTPGATSSIALTVSVTAAAMPSVTNVATVSTPGDAVPTNNTASDPTNVVAPAPDVAITKTVTSPFVVGQRATYSISVRNLSLGPTTGATTVSDVLPAGLSFVSATGTGWACGSAAGTVSCTYAAILAAGATANITLTVDVNAAARPAVTNTATVATPGDTDPTNNTSTVTVPVNLIDLAIDKSHTGVFTVGSNGVYTLIVTNVGNAASVGATTVVDNLPNGLQFVSAAGTGWSCSATGAAVTCGYPASLAPGETSRITLTVAVSAAAVPSVTNVATVSTPGDAVPTNNTASDPTLVQDSPQQVLDLEIIKSSSALDSGKTGTFTLDVGNVGSKPTATVITVTDTLPAGVRFVSGSGGGFSCSSVGGQVVSCTSGTVLSPNQRANIQLTVSVTAPPRSRITNRGWVRTAGDINPRNDSSSVATTIGNGGLSPDLKMLKEIVVRGAIGADVTFRLTVTNVGAGSTTDSITVSDTLPNGLLYRSASGRIVRGVGTWRCLASGQIVRCVNPGPMQPRDTSEITIRATLNTATYTNRAWVRTLNDGNPVNDSSAVMDSFPQPPGRRLDLLTKKTADSASFSVGRTASYTITVTNLDTDSATTQPITITDIVPAGLVPVSASGALWVCQIAGQTITCTRTARLAPKDSTSVRVVANVLAAAVPSVTNSAYHTSPEDDNPKNDSSSVSTPVGAVVDLSILKESVGQFKVGGQGRFTLTVRNIGANDATPPITVRDTLPAGFTYVSATGTGWACSVSGNVVTCVRNTLLASGASTTIDLVGTVGSLALPQITNCARVSGTNETGTLANNLSCTNVTIVGEPRLEITKSVSRAEASIGDVLDYTLVVRNTGTADLTNAIVVDNLPRGFAYVDKTARLDNSSLADPTGTPGPTLRFAIGALRMNVPVRVTYRVRVTAAVALGNNTNVAIVSAPDGSGPSEPSRATTKIVAGLFEERGAIIGKVFTQCNCASLMQEAGEVGIPGVRVYLEDGSSAVTDVEGKYSFYGVSARLHVVKVDRASLPKGAVMTVLANRNALDGYSRFADVKVGELHKADFAEGSGSAEVLQLVLARRRAGEVENAGTQVGEAARAPQLSNAAAPAVDARGATLGAATPVDSIKIRYSSPVANVQLSHDSVSGAMNTGSTYSPIGTVGTLTDRNSQLPITPLRAQSAREGRNPLGYGRVQVELPQEGIPADGQTLVSIVVRITDREGKPLTGRVPVTLEASLGRWLGDEINATEQGRQVILDGGVGRYTLIAAAQPGRGEVRVTSPDGSQTLPITFVPALRPMMAVGLLNARIDFRSLISGGKALASDANGFEESLRDWTFDNDSGKVRGGARGALLLKGRVLNDQLLTLSYDSERDRGRTLFRDIRPDEFFPVYGDAGLREFDAQSRRKFYARLDRGASYTMFGDFQTTRADERRVLTAFDRTLNGAVEHLEGKRGAATLFASQGRSRQVVDELPGRGISGPYVLTQAQGLVNSERVEIVTRDRNQPSVILSRVSLTRFADYTIEPLTGRLLMRAPVPSADANLNPVSIRVTYEAENVGAERYWTYGGDGTLRVSSNFELGATVARDENPLLKSTLAGVNATAQLGKGTVAFGEFAQTDRSGTKGDAFRVEVRHQSEKVEGRLFAARSDSAFSNTSSTFYGGRTEFGGRFSTALDTKTRLVGEALRTENNSSIDGRRDGAMLGFERQLNKDWRAEFGYRYAKESGNFSPYPGATPLQLNRNLVDSDVSALRGRLNYTLPANTRSALFAEYEQDIRDDSHRGAVGGEYLISNRARLYGRHEWLTGLEGAYATNGGTAQQYTVFGVDADYLKNTQMFSEYRARDAYAGRDAEASIGLRNRWAVAPGLSINTSFERVSPLFGSVPASLNGTSGDALAATGAVEWTRPSLWKTTARLEFRDADNGDNFLASLGYARKLSRDWTLLGRTLWDVYDIQQNQTRGWSQLGLAWRQTDRNRWNALMRYENRLTRLGSIGTTLATENMAHILAGLVNFQPTARVTLSGRYAGKLARDDIGTLSTTTNAQLFMGRGIFDLNRHLDAGIIGSVLATDGFGSRSYGLGGELGVIMLRNLRIAGGYNLFGFTDKDLNTFGTTRKGAYLELGFKFDESLFGLGGNETPCDNACRAGGKKE